MSKCRRSRLRNTSLVLAALASLPAVSFAQTDAPSREDLAFFEKSVRPLLAQKCYGCHGKAKQRSQLRLDHIDFALRGGARGPAISREDAQGSRLLHAVRYQDKDLAMPPKSRLADSEVAVLAEWLERGAPWPDEARPSEAAEPAKFDLRARRAAHWCWQAPESTATPKTADRGWARNSIDSYVLARLEAAQLQPAPDADRHTWLRRVHFDLTGLPPKPDLIRGFLNDRGPGAHARVVDFLLASPDFAENWAQHWLDLVRFAESYGHEFDFPIQNAWRYRDYVIRAVDRDVPYDQFVREHIAGDLLPVSDRRKHPEEGFDESSLATGFWLLGEQTHSPVDARKHQADRVDNQIDVMSKAFLGVTLSCARCHDHKFDAISTKDYYAAFGFLESSRYAQHCIEDREKTQRTIASLRKSEAELNAFALDTWRRRSKALPRYLLAAEGVRTAAQRAEREAKREHAKIKDRRERDKRIRKARAKAKETSVAKSANDFELERDELKRWVDALDAVARTRPNEAHPLHAWFSPTATRRSTPEPLPSPRAQDRVFADFTKGTTDFDAWQRDGHGFGDRPRSAGLGTPSADDKRLYLQARVGSAASTLGAALTLHGTLYSPSFLVHKRFVHIRASGRGSRINVVPEGFTLLRNPIWGHCKIYVDSDDVRWYRIDLGKQRGMRANVELLDNPIGDPADPRRGSYSKTSWLSVERIVFSDEAAHPHVPAPHSFVQLRTSDRERLANAYAAATRRAVRAVRANCASRTQLRWLGWLGRHGLLLGASTWEDDTRELITALRAHNAQLSERSFAPALRDASPVDHAVHIRGSHTSLGEVVPPRFLEALSACSDARALAAERQSGSGRLALARAITNPANPLTARVFVNRAWHHMFGRGLVATTDNFGVLGATPTHPALLDRLALDFMTKDGWSLKKLLRRMALSSTYRMSSRAHAATAARAREVDGNNDLLHAFRVRRLRGEALRDAILAVSGRLDPKRFGRSVDVHLTPFMSGRGRPRSGPLDGAGRRSIYLQVKRNFVNPFLAAFDKPNPVSTRGRRSQSNVPAQALSLLNDDFVIEQAKVWAHRVLGSIRSRDARIAAMFEAALGRPVTPDEVESCRAFLEASVAKTLEASKADPPKDPSKDPSKKRSSSPQRIAFEDLAHVLFNLKEFAWIR